ncbi:uncharacterized protein LOC119769355 [Culex quinquefasciatus]|uniref:uncharacterized protein LOC119769355 n=1 Tax=Culex quinquefasciatus TaxID=7176 RepID=UPI0018E3450F|nr:uncharacterized protein LOC119769355 [Culex quinquefasciatus]
MSLARNQSGYRKRYGTTTALAKVTHDIYGNLDAGRCTVMVLVDFSLAFNCVDHQLLATKLNREFRFSRPACELVSSFLGERKQSVRLYINSLPASLKCNYQLYADDLQIYVSGEIDEVDRLIGTINMDLEAITHWATENRLHPNPKKTQAIVFSRSGRVVPQSDIVFKGEVVPVAEKVTNLGLEMDSAMSWTHQVNSVVQRPTTLCGPSDDSLESSLVPQSGSWFRQ